MHGHASGEGKKAAMLAVMVTATTAARVSMQTQRGRQIELGMQEFTWMPLIPRLLR